MVNKQVGFVSAPESAIRAFEWLFVGMRQAMCEQNGQLLRCIGAGVTMIGRRCREVELAHVPIEIMLPSTFKLANVANIEHIGQFFRMCCSMMT